MKAAVHDSRDRSIDVLVANWPVPVLALKQFAPPLFHDLRLRYRYISNSLFPYNACRIDGGRSIANTLFISNNKPWIFCACSESYLSLVMRRAIKYTTCLAHTFVECLKKRCETKLRCLDLSGYPTGTLVETGVLISVAVLQVRF